MVIQELINVILAAILATLGITVFFSTQTEQRYVIKNGCLHSRIIYTKGLNSDTTMTFITCEKYKFNSYLRRNEQERKRNPL